MLSSIVSVLPVTPSGRLSESVAVSPGQGRHSGSFALGSAWTTGTPASSACHTGLMSRRHSSVHDVDFGAVRTTGDRWSSTERQLISGA